MMEPLAVPIAETARLSGVGRSTIYNEIANGNLEAHKVARRTIIKMENLRIWMAGRDLYLPPASTNDLQRD